MHEIRKKHMFLSCPIYNFRLELSGQQAIDEQSGNKCSALGLPAEFFCEKRKSQMMKHSMERICVVVVDLSLVTCVAKLIHSPYNSTGVVARCVHSKWMDDPNNMANTFFTFSGCCARLSLKQFNISSCSEEMNNGFSVLVCLFIRMGVCVCVQSKKKLFPLENN